MKTIALAASLTLAFAVNGLAQKCKEYSAPGGSFAYCPPAGWIGSSKAGDKFNTFEAPATEGEIGGHLSIAEDKVENNREVLAFGLVKTFLQGETFTDKRVVFAGDFDTTSGLHGTKIVFFLTNQNLRFAQAYYVIDGPKDAKYTFILTTAQSDKALAQSGEAAVRTLRLK